jgi:4-diphosphocytidyl-2-C-methyl-D-erythritol kinase
MNKLKLYSPAKINLTLEIIKKFPHGFHGLRSVMIKTQNLKDEIEITFNKRKEGIRIFCSDKNIPTDERNICHKVARKFFEASNKEIGLTIKIKKKIPALAGLGGGSSNGAVVLLALNKYFKEPLSFNKLVQIASQVGKDIPFFLLKDRVAYVSGLGEKLKPVKDFPELNFLLINPKGEIVTGWAYSELDKKMWFMENKKRKNISQQLLKNSSNINNIGALLYNDFDLVAQKLFPIIGELKNCLLALGAKGVSITGKGPTIVGIFKTKKEALEISEIIKNKYPKFFVEIG